MKIEFTIPGNPIPWKRARRRGDRYFTHPAVVEWQGEIIAAYLEFCNRDMRRFLFPAIPMEKERNIILVLRFYQGTRHRTDLSNLEKVIEDTLETYIWENDWQIKKKISEVFYDKENPRVELEVKTLDE